jgi:glycosyltransferase involved in cell wall biosynthesis
VYCLFERGGFSKELEAGGVNVVCGMEKVRRFIGWNQLFATLVLVFRLANFLRRKRATVVHGFLPLACIIAAIAGKLARSPHVLLSRRSRNHYQQKHPVSGRVERSLQKRVDGVLANSRMVASDLIDEGCPPERVALIFNGIPVERFLEESPGADATDSSPFVAVIVANLIPYKGHEDLLRALGMNKGTLPNGWRLDCVGMDAGILDELKELATSLGIADNINWVGGAEDVRPYLWGANVGLLTSHEEGFSNSILEGMAAGLPMVVTDVGGNAEAVGHEVCGLVVPAQDPDRLGQAINKLAGDVELREQYGCAARERVAERFSMRSCVENYLRLYDAVENSERLGEVFPT